MIIPIVTAAIVLGRGFNFDKMEATSAYIFDTDDIKKNLVKIPLTTTKTEYRIIADSADANDFLNIKGTIGIKVKQGAFGIQGSGEYLLKDIKRENSVELLIQVYHETVTETFPSYTKHFSDYFNKGPEALGSHYMRSVTYGGQLIIQYVLRANSSEHMEDIKAAVSANLAISGTFDGEVKGRLKKLSKQIGSKADTEIKAYSTTHTPDTPRNLDAVFELVKKYPKRVEELNNGKGSPLRLEILGLETLKNEPEKYVENLALDSLLNEAVNKYDDIRAAHKINMHMERPIQTAEMLEKFDQFLDYMYKANQAFEDAIATLKGDGGLEQFDKAFEAYSAGGANIPNRFTRELTAFQNAFKNIKPLWFPYSTALTHFIHWGSVNCTLPSPEPVYVGLAATSPKGYGNGGSIECLPTYSPEVDGRNLKANTTESHINGLIYTLPGGATGPVLCALCRLENATSTFMIPARNECPDETKLEYSGFMMVGKRAGSTSRFVCMDGHPDHDIRDVTIGFDQTAGSLEPVWTKCMEDDDECDPGDDKKYVNCIVCSR